MSRHRDLIAVLAERIAAGELAAGSALPAVRALAAQQSTSPATVMRAYRVLADAGAIVSEPRRVARVAPDGAVAARWLLRGGRSFRLGGSDDPALSLLVQRAGREIAAVGARGSHRGLAALWSGAADGAALHLRHRSGEYNTPFARGVLAGRQPVLVHLWRREQGLIVPRGNPRGIGGIADLRELRIARRPPGTGTRALLDRLALEAGLDPDALAGPQHEAHLDVALAVATGEADVGLGLRSSAHALGLDFVALVWEPFEVTTGEQQLGGMQPLLTLLEDPAVHARLAELSGYDLAGAGEVRTVG